MIVNSYKRHLNLLKGVDKAAKLTMAVLNWLPFSLSCVSSPCNLAFPFLEPLQFGIICKYEEDVPMFPANYLHQQPQ